MAKVLLLLAISTSVANCWIVDPGPTIIATKGEVWPKPQEEEKFSELFTVDWSDFRFNVVGNTCSLLEDGISRYRYVISKLSKLAKKFQRKRKRTTVRVDPLGSISSLDINMLDTCSGIEYPATDKSLESYNLTVPRSTSEVAQLTASSIWGILRGLETFSQLIYLYDDDANLYMNATSIYDFPRFGHRGLLLDTSRHYMPMDIIYKMLEGMEYNKMNIFHWHIVDDQSFPYVSALYPELSEEGAYHPVYKIYSRTDIRNIIEYARVRGIRVMPEFDTPGHTRSWGEGIPELLVGCYENGAPTGRYGPMDPSREFVFSFLDEFFGEVNSTFPDTYVHLGGDEVSYDCWETNPDLNHWMDANDMTGDYKAVERYFMERLMNITIPKQIVPVLWEEAFDAGTIIPDDAIIQIWYGGYQSLRTVTAAGKKALLSSCWYLDHLATGGDWIKFYECDPQDFGGSNEDFERILGGEACMWAEVVNRQNVLQRVWPRASAVAEKLWSTHNADTIENTQKRIEEHACRMNRRDIPAQPPNHAGYCLL